MLTVLKGTYRREIHLSFCSARQVIEITNILSALRAHHKPTIGIEITVFGAVQPRIAIIWLSVESA